MLQFHTVVIDTVRAREEVTYADIELYYPAYVENEKRKWKNIEEPISYTLQFQFFKGSIYDILSH